MMVVIVIVSQILTLKCFISTYILRQIKGSHNRQHKKKSKFTIQDKCTFLFCCSEMLSNSIPPNCSSDYMLHPLTWYSFTKSFSSLQKLLLTDALHAEGDSFSSTHVFESSRYCMLREKEFMSISFRSSVVKYYHHTITLF